MTRAGELERPGHESFCVEDGQLRQTHFSWPSKKTEDNCDLRMTPALWPPPPPCSQEDNKGDFSQPALKIRVTQEEKEASQSLWRFLAGF